MKILRLTRHPAVPEQLAELTRIYGAEAEVVEHSETVPSVERVKEILAGHSADVLEAVLPLPLMAQCLDPKNGVGIPVIRAITVRELQPDGTKVDFRFSHYERIVKVEVVTERL